MKLPDRRLNRLRSSLIVHLMCNRQTDLTNWLKTHHVLVHVRKYFSLRLLGNDSAVTDYKPLSKFQFSLWCTLVTTWASTLLTLRLYRANHNLHPQAAQIRTVTWTCESVLILSDQNQAFFTWEIHKLDMTRISTMRYARKYISFCSTKCCWLPTSSFGLFPSPVWWPNRASACRLFQA